MHARSLLPVAALLLGVGRAAAQAEPSSSAAGAASSAAGAASSAASSAPSSPPPSLRGRKDRGAPTEVEILDPADDRDPQGLGMGAQLGVGLLAVRGGGAVQATPDLALVAEFGLGPNGARVPWTLEPWIAFAAPFTYLFAQGGYPNRFTELGVRLVYRGRDDSALAHHWVSLGLGAVWTNTRPSNGIFDPRNLCTSDVAAAEAVGLDCSRNGGISPGGLVDLGVGLYEVTVRRARWGVGARVPVQLSAYPGIGVLGFVYAQIGTAL